jgi:hypothetical protein
MERARSELQVPKQTVAVELCLEGEAPQAVELFVGTRRFRSAPAEEIGELLENAPGFLPVLDRAEKTCWLVSADRILWVSVARATPDDAALEPADEIELYEVSRRVCVEIAGGAALSGELFFGAQERGSRVLDYLNAPAKLLRLWSGDRLYLVRKSAIRRVREEP